MPGPSIKPFLLVGVVLLVLVEPVTSSSTYAPDWRKTKLCQAGYYRAPETRNCKQCQEGVDFTNHSNNLPSCRPCSTCGTDKEKKSPCTITSDTVCQCKPGTFQDREHTEFCELCTKCGDEFVEESPCVPWSDRKCVHKDSGTKASRETPASAEPVTATLSTATCPHPSSDHAGHGNKDMMIVLCTLAAIGITLVILFVWKCRLREALTRVKNGLRSGQDSEHLHTVLCCTSRGSEAQDNDHNEILSSQNSPTALDLEQQRERPDQEAGVPEEFPGEVASLLRRAETERAPKRRRLIPAEGTDTNEALRDLCNYQNVIPYGSWDRLMRLLGLTDNEIQVIRCGTVNQGDVLYQMMVKWLNKMGRNACINRLLDALETLQERNAREKIEDDMVRSGKFVYEEDGADSAVSIL